MHVRDQIRAYIAQRLSDVDGLRDHITIDAHAVPDEIESPWAFVSIGDEVVTNRTLGGAGHASKLWRETDLNIDIIGRDRTDVAGQVGEIAASIEVLLAADPLLGGLAKRSALLAMRPEKLSDASQPMMRLRMQYQITYMTSAADPRTAL